MTCHWQAVSISESISWPSRAAHCRWPWWYQGPFLMATWLERGVRDHRAWAAKRGIPSCWNDGRVNRRGFSFIISKKYKKRRAKALNVGILIRVGSNFLFRTITYYYASKGPMLHTVTQPTIIIFQKKEASKIYILLTDEMLNLGHERYNHKITPAAFF